MRFCWACWLFQPHGEASIDFWRSEPLAPEAIVKRSALQTLRGRAGFSLFSRGAAHCIGNQQCTCHALLPEGSQRIKSIVYNGVEAIESKSTTERHERAVLQPFQDNWEVQFWLGQQDLFGVNTSLAKDKRIRCPRCVLMNNPLRLQDRGMKIVRPNVQIDLSELLEITLRRRASLLGYKWDPRRKVFSMLEIRKDLSPRCK